MSDSSSLSRLHQCLTCGRIIDTAECSKCARDESIARNPRIILQRDSFGELLVRMRVQVVQTHPPVLCDYNHPPEKPRPGQRFGILDSPEGEWRDCPNGIAQWDGRSWQLTPPQVGMVVLNREEDACFLFTPQGWAKIQILH